MADKHAHFTFFSLSTHAPTKPNSRSFYNLPPQSVCAHLLPLIFPVSTFSFIHPSGSFEPLSFSFDSQSLCNPFLLFSLPFFSQGKVIFCIQSMASELDVSEISSMFERMVRNRDLSLFLPFIFGLSNPASRRDGEDSGQENESEESTPRERIILINPFTQGMVVIDGASSLETLFRELGSSKGGQPPASKESIDSLPSVEIGEGEDGECVICLEEWEAGGVVKEMPCKHKFHPNCIEKWLGIHGSCPVCRYEMPIDEEVGKKKDEEDGEERRRRVGREVWVSFSFNSDGRRSEDSNQAPSDDSNDSSSSPRGDAEDVYR